jgi:hypothetical protein
MSVFCIELNIKPPSSSSSAATSKNTAEETSNRNTKTASINFVDAQRVDVRDGESALILRVLPSQSSVLLSEQQAYVSSVCQVRVSLSSPLLTGTQSQQRQKRGGGQSIAPGHVHISPISLYQHFLVKNIVDDVATAKEKAEVAAHCTQKAPTASYTSPSKSTFSFAKGGGGDKLTSPQRVTETPSNRSTPILSCAKLKQDEGTSCFSDKSTSQNYLP